MNESFVLRSASDKTRSINTVTATAIDEKAIIFPITELGLNDFAARINITIPPDISE
jgi:hypothetical protein